MWFPFNFAKNLKDRHFVVGGSKNLKLSLVLIFEIKGAKKYKIFNFLKVRFYVMGGPMDMSFACF